MSSAIQKHRVVIARDLGKQGARFNSHLIRPDQT